MLSFCVLEVLLFTSFDHIVLAYFKHWTTIYLKF